MPPLPSLLTLRGLFLSFLHSPAMAPVFSLINHMDYSDIAPQEQGLFCLSLQNIEQSQVQCVHAQEWLKAVEKYWTEKVF